MKKKDRGDGLGRLWRLFGALFCPASAVLLLALAVPLPLVVLGPLSIQMERYVSAAASDGRCLHAAVRGEALESLDQPTKPILSTQLTSHCLAGRAIAVEEHGGGSRNNQRDW